jgi:hypothetical protein
LVRREYGVFLPRIRRLFRGHGLSPDVKKPLMRLGSCYFSGKGFFN